MNKTKIEWCDSTWNPVTGCLHGCEYCYARKIADRFGLSFAPKLDEVDGCKYDSPEGLDTMLELNKPYHKGGQMQPYPMAFLPTFHKYRLEEPARKTKGQNIFVCSMADLFGNWVPQEWINEVFEACDNAQQHNYLFLTKNAKGYERAIDNFACEDRGSEDCNELFKNFWFGTSITTGQDLLKIEKLAELEEGHRFLSIEPILEPIELNFGKDRCPVCGSSEVYQDNSATVMGLPEWHCDCCCEWDSVDGKDLKPSIDWVIIGAETGNRKGKVIPQKQWIESIIEECKKFNIPVFMKNSLIPIVGEENMLREFPEGLRR